MAIPENIDAVEKLKELLHCGKERVELSAAKELIALQEDENSEKESMPTTFSVEIRVVEGDG